MTCPVCGGNVTFTELVAFWKTQLDDLRAVVQHEVFWQIRAAEEDVRDAWAQTRKGRRFVSAEELKRRRALGPPPPVIHQDSKEES